MDVLIVIDGPRVEQAAYLNVALSSLLEADFTYHLATPADATSTLDWSALEAACRIERYAIPAPDLQVGGRPYRIVNKVAALKHAPVRRAVLVDSDTFFNTRADVAFLFRHRTAAAPEHNPLPLEDLDALWHRLYETFGLEIPDLRVMTGSKRYAMPYFNAGVVATPDAPAFGALWADTMIGVNACDWLPRRFPYLDQFALPLAMAREGGGRLGNACVLPASYNCNLFHFQNMFAIERDHVVYHHHNRVSMLRALFTVKLATVVQRYEPVRAMLPEMARSEFASYVRQQLERKAADSA